MSGLLTRRIVEIASRIVPESVADAIRRRTRARQHKRNQQESAREVFSTIYANNVWGGSRGEFCSGGGSVSETTASYVDFVTRFIEEHRDEVRRVVDLGCGDFRVGREIAKAGVAYTGVDVVPDLISHLSEKYGQENRKFACLDIASDPLPEGDLCLIRQVLQHLSNEQIAGVIRQVQHYKFVLVTEHLPSPAVAPTPNIDKVHGSDVRLEDDSGVFLDQAPFSLSNVERVLEVAPVKPVRHPGERIVTFLMTNP